MKPNRNHTQSGLSLIELMIAITISLALLTGVVQIFSSSKAAYRTQEALSRVSENIRFAIETLNQDISRANFWGCNTDPAMVANHLNSASPNFIDFAAGGLIGSEGNNGDPDTIRVRGLYGIPATTQNVVGADQPVNLRAVNNNILPDSILAISDCRNTDIFQVTGISENNGVTVLEHGIVATQSPGNIRNRLSREDYGENSIIYRADEILYSIGPDNQDGGNNRNALIRQRNGVPVPLISDVDDFQVVYGEDTDNDQIVNRYVPAGTAGLNFANVISVRVTLTLSSPQDNVSPAQRNLGGGITDNRLARTITSTIALKNQLP